MATSADLLSLSIDTAGTFEQVLARLDAIPQGINKAKARALRRLKTWLNRQVAKAVSAATGVTQAKWKALLRLRSGKTATGGIVIWIGTNPIAAQYLGKVTWTRRMKGARAGRQLFPGTWSWAAKSGAKTGAGIMELMTDLNRNGTTIIMVTHDPNIAEYSKRTIRIADGRIVA
jgi:hypothetical protein